MTDRIFACVDARAEQHKQLLQQIVSMDSYTPDKQDVDAVGARLRDFALEQGFRVDTVPFEKAGDGLLITYNDGAPLPPVVFTGHLDTVFPRGTFQEPLFRQEGDKYFGPGVVDMKGGLVQGLLTMCALKDAGYTDRPIKFIIIGDEECSEGLSGEAGKDFIRDNARGAAAAITLEGITNEEKITVGRKGSIRYEVYVEGRASHAGSKYAEGISAIKEAARKILDIEAPSDQAQITYNCGMIKGGTAPNTVPGEAMFTLDNRYWKLEQRQIIRDHVEGIVAKSYIPGTKSAFKIIGERPPMDDTPGNYALADHIAQTSKKYGFGEMTAQLTSAGSDASYTTMAGAPSVCSMGPIGGRAHSTDEFMYADSLIRRAKLLAAVVAELPEAFGK